MACTRVTAGTTCDFRPPCWCSKYQYGGRVLVTNTCIKWRFFPVSPPQMPMCLIVGCSRKCGGARGIRLCRVPAVVTNQGPEVEELSIERRRRWISAISRDDLTEKILNNDRVCDQHFHSGTAAPLWDRHNIDWVPTLNLGHGKSVKRREQNESQEA